MCTTTNRIVHLRDKVTYQLREAGAFAKVLTFAPLAGEQEPQTELYISAGQSYVPVGGLSRRLDTAEGYGPKCNSFEGYVPVAGGRRKRYHRQNCTSTVMTKLRTRSRRPEPWLGNRYHGMCTITDRVVHVQNIVMYQWLGWGWGTCTGTMYKTRVIPVAGGAMVGEQDIYRTRVRTSSGRPEPLPELCDCSMRSLRDSPGGMYVSQCSASSRY